MECKRDPITFMLLQYLVRLRLLVVAVAVAKSTAPGRSVASYPRARLARPRLLGLQLLGMEHATSTTTATFWSVAPYLLALRLRLIGMEHAVSTSTVYGCRGASLVVALVNGMAMAVFTMTFLGRSGTTLVVAVWCDVAGMAIAVSTMTGRGRSGTTLVVAVWCDASMTRRIGPML